MSFLVKSGLFLLAVVVVVAVGIRVRPAPFSPGALETPDLPRTSLPDDLPAPVTRFYSEIYGDRIPEVESAVIMGRVDMRVMGIPLRGRFRFTHLAGQDYRHYIETTVFGIPALEIDERYIEGRGMLDLPFGRIEGEPNIDQAANLGLWAESAVWLPALLVTDPRVKWEAVDRDTAILAVPFGDETERFVARFDPETGLLRMLESMRYREAEDSEPTLWINEVLEWGEVDGFPVAVDSQLTWYKDARPWARFQLDSIRYDVSVQEDLPDELR
ncbi:MAG: DUF6544 family protein [Clostridia bacterium]